MRKPWKNEEQGSKLPEHIFFSFLTLYSPLLIEIGFLEIT